MRLLLSPFVEPGGGGTYDRGFEAFARDWMDGAMPFGSPLHHLLSYAEGFAVNRYYDDDDVGCDETASSSSSSSETATTSHEHSGSIHTHPKKRKD